MKRIVLLLPLAMAGCGDDSAARLEQCKDDIRAELTALLEKTKHDTAESIAAIAAEKPAGHDAEPPSDHPTDRPQAREAADTVNKLSNDMIKAMPDLLAAMAVPLIEAQLQALEPTPADIAKCQQLLTQARQR